MKNSDSIHLHSPSPSCAGLAPALAILLLGATALQAQTHIINDNFDDQSDSLWTHYDLGPITAAYDGGHPYGAAHFSFPANPGGPSGNYGYRILADPTWLTLTGSDPIPIGNARAAAFRTQELYRAIRFEIGVDLVAGTTRPNLDQNIGIIFNAQPATIGPGRPMAIPQLSSRLITPFTSRISLGKCTTTMGRVQGIPLDPTQQYRMVVSSADLLTFLCTLYHLPDTNNPWISAITTDITYAYAPGYGGLVVEQQNYPSPVAGAATTYDNYHSDSPDAGAMPATVTDLYPQPAGKATDLYPTVTVGILSESRDSAVNTGTIQLYQDGVLIGGGNPNLYIDTSFVYKPNNEGSYPKTFAGATVYYTNTTLFPPGSKHTNEIVFQDNASPTPAWHTNIWAWTTAYPYLYASNSLPIGSLSVPGFDARMVHSSAANIDGSLFNDPTNSIPNLVASAQAVLAGQFAVDLTSTNYVQVVAYGLAGNESGAITNFPGLCLNPPPHGVTALPSRP